MQRQEMYSSGSMPYHMYASCTQITIDRNGSRIALTYDIDLDDKTLADRKTGRAAFIKFMELVYHRILKLEHERVFARHYAPAFINFRETSVALHFSRSTPEVTFSLPALVLNDFNSKSADSKMLSNLNASYSLDQLVKNLYPDGGASGKS